MKPTLLLSFMLAAVATAAGAQAPPTPATPPQATAPGPNLNEACAPSTRGTPAPDGVTTGQSEPLGDKLAKSGGVLCPPSTADSEIHVPTPEGGNTPVIPPPGSPGGNPNVIPK